MLSNYNIASCLLLSLIPKMAYDESVLYTILSLNALNVVFVTPFIILVMLVANLIAVIQKRKNNINKTVNIILITILF